MIGTSKKGSVALQICAEGENGRSMDSLLLLFALAAAFIAMQPLTAAAGAATSSLVPDFRGIPVEGLKYYENSTIWCRDHCKTFSRERLNDNFCDCADGTDEPGTSACPNGRFSCTKSGSKVEVVFASRVNDGICDCCDGSDEYDGQIICQDTCEVKSVEDKRELEVSGEGVPLEYSKLLRSKQNENDLLKQDDHMPNVLYSIERQDVKVVLFLEVAVVAVLLCCHGCKCQKVKHSLKRGLIKSSLS